jgi:hypothetical protein
VGCDANPVSVYMAMFMVSRLAVNVNPSPRPSRSGGRACLVRWEIRDCLTAAAFGSKLMQWRTRKSQGARI